METIDRIRELCKANEIKSITNLEKHLGYSNGSLGKAKDIPSSKIKEIASYFNVTMEYLMTGEDSSTSKLFGDEKAHMLAKIATNVELSNAMLKYFELSDAKKKHILELIEFLSEK